MYMDGLQKYTVNIIHKNMKVELYISNMQVYTRKQESNQSTTSLDCLHFKVEMFLPFLCISHIFNYHNNEHFFLT
jgi:hypothetical protein